MLRAVCVVAVFAAAHAVPALHSFPDLGHLQLVRQIVAQDAIGTFRWGNNLGQVCPNSIRHTATVPEGGNAIQHSAMTMNSRDCDDGGEMTIVASAQDAINGVVDFAPSGSDVNVVRRRITTFVGEGLSIIFGVETSGRSCGSSKVLNLANGTLIMLFIPESNGIVDGQFYFNTQRYMIVDDPTLPSYCIYRSDRRDTDVPIVGPSPTPSPDASQSPVTDPSPGPEDPNVSPSPDGGDGPNGGSGAGDDDGSMDPTPSPGNDNGSGDGNGDGGDDGSDDGNDDDGGAPVVVPGTGNDGNENGSGDDEGESPPDDESGSDNGSNGPSPEAEISAEASPEDGDEEGEGEDDDGSVCFPADATVELEDGRIKTMSEVQLGDRVMVGDGVFSDVFMFTHKDFAVKHLFVRLTTASGAQLSATKGHYIYVNGNFAAAGSAKIGDSLQLSNGRQSVVTTVETISSVGLFNPQTIHGDIIVNSVRASTFTRTVEPVTAQTMLAPFRMLYSAFGWTASFLENGADQVAAILPKGQMAL